MAASQTTSQLAVNKPQGEQDLSGFPSPSFSEAASTSSDFSWGAVEQLAWLWLTPLFAVAVIWSWRRRQQRLVRLLGSAAPALLSHRAYLKMALLLLAVTCIVVALARPRLGFDWAEVKKRGVDVVIAVDVSRSMLAADIEPNRLTRARRELLDLLNEVKGDRIGLVAFAGDAFVQCPLTEDYAAVRLFLDVLDPALIPVQGTNLARAISVSLDALSEGSPDLKGSPSIILITDGEDFAGEVEQAVSLAKEKGVRIFTIGIGSAEGAPIPEPQGGFKQDQAGNLIVTKPDEQSLQKIALATDGVYVRSIAGAMDLEKIYKQGVRRGAELTEFRSQRERLWHERFQWPLVLAVFLLFLESWLPDRLLPSRRVTTTAKLNVISLVCLGLAILTQAPSAWADSAAATAAKAYQDGNFAAAAQGFATAEGQDPTDLRATYNRALSAYRAGDLKQAAEGFAKAAAAKDSDVASRSLFNLGNSLAELGQYDEASQAFSALLARQPDDQEARENLAAVEKLKANQPPKPESTPPPQETKESEDEPQNQPEKSSSPQSDSGEPQDQEKQTNQQPQQSEHERAQSQSEQKSQEGQDAAQQPDQTTNANQDQAKQQSGDTESKSATQPGNISESKQGNNTDGTATTPKKDGSAETIQPSAKETITNIEKVEALLRSLDDNPGKYFYRQGSEKSDVKETQKDW